MNVHLILFLAFGAVAVAGAINLLAQTHPINSALSLIAVMAALAGEYLLLGAEFVAAVQVIVYAGAIMVLFLFVIMLLNLRQPEEAPVIPHIGQKLLAAVLAGFTALIMIYAYRHASLPGGPEVIPGLGNTESIARSLFTNYLLPFEVTSVLLLVAIVGAVVLAKSKLK